MSKFMTLIIFGVFSLVLRLSCWNGLIASDDVVYSEFAQSLIKGSYKLVAHHYAIRFGVIIPQAITYWLFGISEWSTILLPLLASAASVCLLMLIGWNLFNFRTGLIAGILYATFPIQLFYATILIPEPIAECIILCSVLLYVKAQKDRRYLFFASGLGLGVAYLTKEPAIFIVPAMAICSLQKKEWKSAILLCLGLMTVLLTEQLVYLVKMGDLFFRLHAMKIHEASLMAIGANQNLIYRLFHSYPRMLIVPNIDFGLHSLCCLMFSGMAIFRIRTLHFKFLFLWAAIPGLYLNFGSSSLTRFFALPVAPRYMEFIFPAMILLTATTFDFIMSTWQKSILIINALILVVAIVGFSCAFSMKGRRYRSVEVSVLRAIAARVEKNPNMKIRFKEPNEWGPWRKTMTILAPKIIAEGDEKTEFVIQSDSLGLPTLVIEH